MFILDEAAARPEAGGKARVLARARAAGVPAPDGFVVPPGDEVDGEELGRHLARLGGARFVVRSSADVEDRADASAAGVFESVVDVGAGEVEAAIGRVRDSAARHPARAYLAARGLARGGVRMAVLVQPLVAARALGVLHTEPSGEGGALFGEEREPTEPEWGRVRGRWIAATDAITLGARRLAAIVGAPADVEYAVTDGGPVFLQARPIAGGGRGAAADPDRWDPGPGPGDDGVWVRDAEHNPLPLSEAQASLVECCNAAGLGEQRVIAGYLFARAQRAQEASDAATEEAHLDGAALRARFAAMQQAIEPSLSAMEREATPDLGQAVALLLEVARRHAGEVRPALRAARRRLDAFLAGAIGEGLAAHAALLGGEEHVTGRRDATLFSLGRASARGEASGEDRAALGRYLARFGAWAPAWDVAVAPDDEAEARVLATAALLARGAPPDARRAEARARAEAALRAIGDRLGGPDRAALGPLVEAARAATAIAEDDDEPWYRAQRLVRRALWARGIAAGLDDPSLVFEVPLEAARAGTIDPVRARDARALRMARAALRPPSRIEGRAPRFDRLAGAGAGPPVLVGAGVPGRAFGKAFVLRDLEAPGLIPAGAVLVAKSIPPALTALLPSVVALVTDHGGALCHGAQLAREYGIPAVLGTGGATSALADGEDLIVDGDAGKVYRLG